MTAPGAEWWLDESALPDLIWACLVDGLDGYRLHLQDGSMALFDTLSEAHLFLREDEYDRLEDLKESGLISATVQPPADFFDPNS